MCGPEPTTLAGKVDDCGLRNGCMNVYIYCYACSKVNNRKYHYPEAQWKKDRGIK